ncbi:hypothetical protein [Reinekea blandensis]|uniref:Uncharacterized protein n=1 Tax=Reinekea blandensis MED297 TaxID=314283 RepID=A4BE72_9GAMM|nr:hypothetical protein [Reinekea blandensis]EAR09550.1 hypothetical protein MED297_12502 [Reinekea blandensis MED297]
MPDIRRFLQTAIIGCSLCSSGQAIELGVDGAFYGGGLVDDWGLSGHAQLIGESGFGLDVGYRHVNQLSYQALNQTLNHSFGQYEVAGLWQAGDEAFRIQLLGGGILSNRWVQSGTEDVIARYAPGYRLDAGVSVPVFTRLRAFAEFGYQGWLDAEMPGQLRWRYGLRILVGGQPESLPNDVTLSDSSSDNALVLSEMPDVVIDPAVPQYVPSHLSQSLPPIVANSEVCKCFPAGPYTLQLGEFASMAQAIRGLEYRGLRQFFNSRTYLRAPLPVFLAQAEAKGPVGLYLGELSSVDEMQFWRHELRKSGLQARFRKVVNSTGERVVNPIVEVNDSMVDKTPIYTAEEIRRMNSLPENDEQNRSSASAMEDERDAISAWQDAQMEQKQELNQVTNEPAEAVFIDEGLQLGPMQQNELLTLLATDTLQAMLARDPKVRSPENSELIWDESRDEAWLYLNGFQDVQQMDEWRAWLESEGLTADRVTDSVNPLGDVYRFALARPITPFSVEMVRQSEAQSLFNSMRSPEVLWFQAFQRINDQSAETSLNYSRQDNRYRLIAVNIADADARARVWADLTAVGLLPALAEE